MMRALIIAATIAAGAAMPTHATTGNELFSSINNEDVGERLWAIGYIKGVSDVANGQYLCAPDGANAGQAKDIVNKFLLEAPQQRHQNAMLLVLAALSRAWPCEPEKPTKGHMNNVRKTT